MASKNGMRLALDSSDPRRIRDGLAANELIVRGLRQRLQQAIGLQADLYTHLTVVQGDVSLADVKAEIEARVDSVLVVQRSIRSGSRGVTR